MPFKYKQIVQVVKATRGWNQPEQGQILVLGRGSERFRYARDINNPKQRRPYYVYFENVIDYPLPTYEEMYKEVME